MAGLSLVTASSFAANFKVDADHSSVGFVVSHMMVSKVKGNFGKFEGEFSTDDKSGKLTKGAGKVEVAAITTGNEKRDEHLRSPDFFDVAKFPTITFKITKVEGTKVTGDFTMKGVTKPLVLEATVSGKVKDPWGNERVGISGSGKINRKDFGLTWNKAMDGGGVVVGEEVTINVEIEGMAPIAKK
ncbi:MAG: YceI family protein [Bdellovibrionales bacterium]|nr:YceI family protein [Bdellovibrionales bacterium]